MAEGLKGLKKRSVKSENLKRRGRYNVYKPDKLDSENVDMVEHSLTRLSSSESEPSRA